jgi:hypothetical protein
MQFRSNAKRLQYIGLVDGRQPDGAIARQVLGLRGANSEELRIAGLLP